MYATRQKKRLFKWAFYTTDVESFFLFVNFFNYLFINGISTLKPLHKSNFSEKAHGCNDFIKRIIQNYCSKKDFNVILMKKLMETFVAYNLHSFECR